MRFQCIHLIWYGRNLCRLSQFSGRTKRSCGKLFGKLCEIFLNCVQLCVRLSHFAFRSTHHEKCCGDTVIVVAIPIETVCMKKLRWKSECTVFGFALFSCCTRGDIKGFIEWVNYVWLALPAGVVCQSRYTFFLVGAAFVYLYSSRDFLHDTVWGL